MNPTPRGDFRWTLLAACGIPLALMGSVAVVWTAQVTRGEEPAIADRSAQVAALEEFNLLIGGWRGVGQPQRGSNKGAWSETADWVWELSRDSAALRYEVKEGRHLASARLTYDPGNKRFVLEGTFQDKTERRYTGQNHENKLTLESEPDEEGVCHQLVLTRLNEKRVLLLYQSRKPNQKQFSRVAEVGYTREGTRLATEGGDGPECIVTGGKGTIRVEYEGKTYWVCCTGCRDAFLDDPAGLIADAAERARRKKSRKD